LAIRDKINIIWTGLRFITLLILSRCVTTAYAWTDSITTADWKLCWGKGKAVAYSLQSHDSLVIFESKDTMLQTSENGDSRDINFYEITAIVGSKISYRHTYDSYGNSNQGNQGEEFVTIDLEKRGKRIGLSDIFDTADILSGLSNDSFIKKHLHQSSSNLTELFDQISGGCEMLMSSGGILRSFTFYDIKDSLVAVRIGIPHKCDITTGKFIQLGLYLPVSGNLRKDLLKASKNQVLMASFQKTKQSLKTK
jgi:hypothetical protein